MTTTDTTHETRQPNDARHHWIEHDGIGLHARELGDPNAPPVVMLHGIMGHSREWDPVAEAMAASHRVLAVDQRGHGRSDHTETYTLGPMTDDIVAVLDDLGVARASIVGHSMGGMVAMSLAAHHPDRVDRLAVIDIVPSSVTPETAAELAGWIRMLGEQAYASVDEAVAAWMAGDPFAKEHHLRRYVEHCVAPGDDGLLRYRFDAERIWRFVTEGVTAEELWEAADAIAAPFLLVTGAESPMTPRSAVDEAVRRTGAIHVEVADGAHDLGVEQPEAVAAVVVDFLDAGR